MRQHGTWRSWLAPLTLAVLMGLPAPLASQSMEGTGLVPTGLLLRKMDGVKRVLLIGAHPDDEDTSFLTALSRGWGVETAYLSLTRGGGGQNLIGPELWEGLGVIRTGELESARALDGGRQFFTRAFDYGFSKSSAEALSLWPREELLEDVTWVVRKFRPHVIVSVFSGTPADGHGQHQAAGIMAREVFAAAGDPNRFPEQLSMGVEAWAPFKLYQSARRRAFGRGGGRGGGAAGRGGGAAGAADDAIIIPTGEMDPLLGRSLFQLSMESRSQHRSQNMGASQPFGPRSTGVIFVDSRVGGEEGGLFTGIDTTLVGIAASIDPEAAEVAAPHLQAYRQAVARARDGLGLDPSVIVPDLAEALQHLVLANRAIGGAANLEYAQVMRQKQRIATQALMAAAGVVFDIRSADDLIVPGQTVEVEVQLWNGGTTPIVAAGIQLVSRDGWDIEWTSVTGLGDNAGVAPGTLASWTYNLTIPEDADVSRLYFLRETRDGARYRWPNEPGLWGLPRDPPALEGAVTFSQVFDDDQLGTRVVATTPWRYVGVDPARGEFEKPVLVVPAVSVDVFPRGMVWPADQSAAQSVTVLVRSEDDEGARGDVTLEVPSGWTATPPSQPFELGGAGAERTLTFEVRPDGRARAGEHTFAAVVTTDDGRTYAEGLTLIDYDHVPRSPMYTDAEANVTVVPVSVTDGLRVGYIMGTGDDGPEAVRQMGAEVEMLGEARVREGDFSAFDAIVVGVRAYEVRADLRAAGEQLLDFARSGGTVVMQYNRGPLGALGVNGLQVGRGRVTEETATVTILEPTSPVFTTPNQITQDDFEGWVQERGLYFAASWGDGYTPLLALNDVGEDPLRGSLLVAPVGDGVFVYAALAFFRQWAGRVPGAYRLFANLISLDSEQWAEFRAGN